MVAFFAPWIAKIVASGAWALVKRYWKPILFGAIGLSVALTVWVQHNKIANRDAELVTAREVIKDAVEANVTSNGTIDKMKADAVENAAITAKSAETSKKITKDHEALKKEIRNAPGATDTAGPYFDDFADRIRMLDHPGSDKDSH